MKKDFISIKDLSLKEIMEIFSLSREIKKFSDAFSDKLKGKTIGLLFEKPSLRTRVSFETGINQMGGHPLYLSPQEVQLGKRESVPDAAKTISRYLDAVIIRTFSHKVILDFVQNAGIPVINALTDLLHPAQVLSDMFTIYDKKKDLKKIKASFIGDGNNICNSLIFASAKLGLSLFIASPKGFEPDKKLVKQAERIALKTGAEITVTNSLKSAAKNSDVLYTDVWVSMGRESEREKRLKAFSPFQLNREVLNLAKKDCLVMHCLPAHRGEEITNEVLDSKNSIVFEQAENRLYVQKAILIALFNRRRRTGRWAGMAHDS